MQMILDPRLLRFCNSRLTLKNLLNFPNCTFPLVDKHSPNGQMVFLFGSIGCFWRFWWHCFYLLSFSSEIRLFIFTGLCHVSCLHVTMSLWHPYFPYNLYKLYIGFKRNEMGRKLFRHKPLSTTGSTWPWHPMSDVSLWGLCGRSSDVCVTLCECRAPGPVFIPESSSSLRPRRYAFKYCANSDNKRTWASLGMGRDESLNFLLS